MARNGSGTYTKVNTFTAGTPITAASHNQNWDDVAAEITNSVAADGQTSMTGPLRAASGTAANPSHTFASDPDTGGYRRGSNEYGFATGGTPAGYFDSSQNFFALGNHSIAGNATIVGTLTVTGAPTFTANGWVALSDISDVAHGKFLGRLSASDGAPESCIVPFHQCQLTKSSSNLLLSPFDGNLLTIDSKAEVIPDAGVTLTTGGLSPSTLYYIYAYMNSGAMTLEASATGYSRQNGSGIVIKSGDSTRTLVAMAMTTSGTAWVDTPSQRHVRSYFNDSGSALNNSFTANRTTGSSSYVELNSEIRTSFLIWDGEVLDCSVDGIVAHDTTNSSVTSSLAIDGTTPEDTVSKFDCPVGNFQSGLAMRLVKTGLSEGSHYVTLIGKNAGSGSSVWLGSGTTGSRVTIKGFLKR